jgi:hypothetical protein
LIGTDCIAADMLIENRIHPQYIALMLFWSIPILFCRALVR